MEANDFVCLFSWYLILLRGGRSSLFSLSYIVIRLSAVMSDLSTH